MEYKKLLYTIFLWFIFFSCELLDAVSVGLSCAARDVAVQSDGKIVLAGKCVDPTNQATFELIRYNTDGTLDTGFDSDGVVTTVIGVRAEANAVAIQPSNQFIVAAGFTRENNTTKFAVARYNTTGALDTTFDSNGYTTTSIGIGASAEAVAIQTDGKIVVAGVAIKNGLSLFAVVRYNSNGSLDTSFDSDGIVTTPVGNSSKAFGVAIQSDGKIVVVGRSDGQFAVVRYNTNGSLDTSFDGDGIVTTSIGSRAVARAVALDGADIVVAGFTKESGKNKFAVARYTSAGALDTAFDTDGIVFTDLGNRARVFDVAVDASSNVIAVGFADDDIALVKYTSAGAVTFSINTTVNGQAQANAVVIDGTGKYVVVAETSTDALALRYNTDGTLDTTFGDEGINDDVGGSAHEGVTVTLLFDRKTPGIAGGTFTSGAWQTRDLNVIRGSKANVSLASNQFTLQQGVYLIEASAPAFRAGLHRMRLFNITDSKGEKLSSSSFAADSPNGSETSSLLTHYLLLSTSKTFEIQHQGEITQATDGFGRAASFAGPEIYTQVKIMRIA